MGKAYANCKKKEDRPEGDFYPTPRSLIWVAQDIIKSEFNGPILEPAAGITLFPPLSSELKKLGYFVIENDLFDGGLDYTEKKSLIAHKQVISNPPFSLWDEFVNKAKSHCDKFMFIGRLNYFGTHSRLNSGLWKNLKAIFPFSRYIDYRTPIREDGLFHVGAMATAWFLWDMNYTEDPRLKVLDVQKYAKLGGIK